MEKFYLLFHYACPTYAGQLKSPHCYPHGVPERYLEDTQWTAVFGALIRQQVEDWGRVTSLRTWYADGREVEFGLTTPAWAAQPLDEGTRRVVCDGMRVLYDCAAYLAWSL
jgi:hypothetical protein